ncbi:ankyrin repeat domain-containing protein [Caviibacter abscessus]|uniref:ankyrin repeat domain-containing protein n=1 Tax=Caviibacter abscessus TaxID=1766719 RepID=UPI00082B5A23|nr:ankyrin repeat domain-containing protein [Caviibacter abscessus]
MKKIFILILLILSNYSFSISINDSNYLSNLEHRLFVDSSLTEFYKAIKLHTNVYAMKFLEPEKKKEVSKNSYDVLSDRNSEAFELFNNIDINSVDLNGYSSLIISAVYNNLEIFKALLKKGASLETKHPILGKTILNTAIYYNSNDVAKYIIENYKEFINRGSDSDGWLPIQEAVLKENEQILKLLLENGAIIRKTDKNGNDAYDIATIHGKGKMVKILRDSEMKKIRFWRKAI